MLLSSDPPRCFGTTHSTESTKDIREGNWGACMCVEREKEEKQKAKDELKKAVKLAKMNKKQKTNDTNVLTDNIITDNVVIGVSDVVITENVVLCTEILKTGPKKGLQCGIKIFQNNLCKRHYNLHNNLEK